MKITSYRMVSGDNVQSFEAEVQRLITGAKFLPLGPPTVTVTAGKPMFFQAMVAGNGDDGNPESCLRDIGHQLNEINNAIRER